MGSRNRSLFYSVFITALIAGTVIYVFGVKPKTSPQASHSLLFSPAEVVQLSWEIQDSTNKVTQNVNFEFSKNPENSLWTPEVEQDRVSSKINTLANMKLAVEPPASEPPLSESPENPTMKYGILLKLKFKSGDTWSGTYTPGYFLWVTGPLANQTAQLSTAELEIFNEGRFAFEPHVWEWCSDHLKKISFAFDEESIELSRSAGAWEVTDFTGDSKIVDSSWVEAWIEKSCQVNVQAWVDLALEPFGLDEGSFEIERADGIPLGFAVKPSSFQITEEKAALSPTLYQNLEELLQAP